MSVATPIVEFSDDELAEPTPTPPTPRPPTVSTPVSDTVWDAVASAGADALPDPDETTTTPTGKLNGKVCEVCGTALVGRQRRFCNDHTQNKTATTGTSTRAKTGTWKGGARVEKHLVDLIEMVGGGLLFSPKDSPLYADGNTIYHHGPKVAHELVLLADDDPRLRKVLERLAAPGKYGGLVLALGGLVLGLAGNHGLLPSTITDGINTVLGGETTV